MFRISPPAGLVRSTLLASAALFVSPFDAGAQTERSTLPPVTVTAPEQKRAASARPPRNAAQSARTTRQARNPVSPPQVPSDQGQGVRGALAVLSAQQALTRDQQHAGWRRDRAGRGLQEFDRRQYHQGHSGLRARRLCPAEMGRRHRLSIRGSGLSRNFHLRGVQLYMDGIPINTADGYGDFQEIDPTAYKYVEVWKGANALQFGANSLGGAINFVMPTGRDPLAERGVGRCRRIRVSSGCRPMPAAPTVLGTVSSPPRPRLSDGFRDHSFGSATRVSGNVGYQFSPDAETRFYFNANEIRQRIPGSVTKQSALTDPRGRRARQRRVGSAAQYRYSAARQQDHDPVSTTPRSNSARSASIAI